MATTTRSALGRFLGVVVDPQTYRNLAYLLLAFPLGLLYFVVIVSGGSAGLSLVPLIVGVPILLAVLGFAAVLADLETRLARGLIGTETAFETPLPTDDGKRLRESVESLVTDPRSYLAVAYLLSKFVIGIAAFVALVTTAAVSGAFAAAPLVYDRPDVTYQVGAWSVETLTGALGLSAIGVLFAVVTLHLVNGAAWLVGEYTAAMLGTSDGEA